MKAALEEDLFQQENYQVESSVVDLVLRAQAGDSDAFASLVSRYERTVQSIARRRLGNAEEAFDLSQDVFIKAYQSLHQLRVPAAFGSWIKTVTHRLASNQLSRRRKPVGVEPEVLDAMCVTDNDPLGKILTEERQEEVRSGLNSLRPLDRLTLEAFYFEGQSLIEMSCAFSAPEGTIKRRLHVARKRLAEIVDDLQAV